MGEIADALRRARARGGADLRPMGAPATPAGTPSPFSGFAPPEDAAPPRLDPGPSEGLPERAQRTLDRLQGASPAIVLEEGPRAETCRRLALRLRAQLEAAGSRSLAVVSAGHSDGKTTVACNLALAFASLSRGRQVALVDLDLRKPSVARALDLPRGTGVEEVLQGRAQAGEAALSLEAPELDLYPTFAPISRAHELLVQPSLARLIEQLERRYETVVVDTPPVLLTPDASLILKHVGACLPLARAGWTRQRSFRALVEQLPRHQTLEGLLNGGRAPGDYGDYDYYAEEEGPLDDAPSIDWTTLRKRWSRRER